MLTAINLPPEYDDLPETGRLWLQTRYDHPPETRHPKKHAATVSPPEPAADGVGGKNDDSASSSLATSTAVAGSGAQASSSSPTKRASGMLNNKVSRPPTVRTFEEAVHIWWLLSSRCQVLFQERYRYLLVPVVIHFGQLLFGGLGGAASLWVKARLMSTIEGSVLNGQPVAWRDAVMSVGAGMALALVQITSSGYINRNRNFVKDQLRFEFERQYHRLKMSQTVHQLRDPVHRAMLYEAAVAVGEENFRFFNTNMWSMTDGMEKVSSLGTVLCCLVNILSFAWLLAGTLHAAFVTQGVLGISTMVIMSVAIKVWKDGFRHFKQIAAGTNRHYYTYGGKFENPHQRTARDFAEMADDTQEVIFFGLGDWILARWEEATAAAINLRRQHADRERQADVSQLDSLINFILQVGVSTQLVPSVNTLSQLTIINDCFSSLFDAVIDFGHALNDARHAAFNLLALTAAIDCLGLEDRLGIDYEKRREPGGMRFETRNLGVTYAGHQHPALRNINLTIKAGETLALVGFNGSGKTTLAKALLGVHGHTGTLLINGIPQTDYKPSSLFARMSCIFQDYRRYSSTLRNNIGLGMIACVDDDDVMMNALVRGGATSLLNDDVQLDTKINRWAKDDDDDERVATYGRSLSGGQWQRVALARAFMRSGSADFIVFDEPSSALDPEAEAELFDRIYDMAHRDGLQTTTVFVSHGFGNVRRADHIAFVAGGTITEYGTHDELMRLKGEYHRLFTLQSRGYVGDGRGDKGGDQVNDSSKVNESVQMTAASCPASIDTSDIIETTTTTTTTTSSSSISVPSLIHTPSFTEDEPSTFIRVESINADTAMPESPMLPAEVWAVGGSETAGC